MAKKTTLPTIKFREKGPKDSQKGKLDSGLRTLGETSPGSNITTTTTTTTTNL